MLGAHADDEEAVGLRERVDQRLHQADVRRAQAAEAEVDAAGAPGVPFRALVRVSHAGADAVPGGLQGGRALVVGFSRIEGEVELRRDVDELAVRQRRSAALDAERAELLLQRLVELAGTRAEVVPAGPVGCGEPREGRGQGRVLHLERVAGNDPRPGHARRHHRREADDVVLHDHVGPELGENLAEALIGVTGAVDEFLPDRQDESFELLDRRLAKLRRRLTDEVLPELARRLLDLGRRLEPHQRLLEALGLERAGERLLDDEDDPDSPFPQYLADPDAVVGGPVRAFREKDDGAFAQAWARACSRSAQSSSASSRPTLRRSRFSGTRSPSHRRRVSITVSTPPRLVAFSIRRTDVSTLAASPSTSNESIPPKPG